jgi:hypothetical protein
MRIVENNDRTGPVLTVVSMCVTLCVMTGSIVQSCPVKAQLRGGQAMQRMLSTRIEEGTAGSGPSITIRSIQSTSLSSRRSLHRSVPNAIHFLHNQTSRCNSAPHRERHVTQDTFEHHGDGPTRDSSGEEGGTSRGREKRDKRTADRGRSICRSDGESDTRGGSRDKTQHDRTSNEATAVPHVGSTAVCELRFSADRQERMGREKPETRRKGLQ